MKELLKNILDEYGVNHYYYGIKKYDAQQKLIELTSFLDNDVKMKERFYCVLNEINILPICGVKSCKNKPKFKNISVGYHDFCSSKCSEQFKRETTNEDGILISSIIGEKIRKDKKTVMSNGKTKGQNARDKQLVKQKEVDPNTGLTGTEMIARKGAKTLAAHGGLKKRGQKIKSIKLEKIDGNGDNGYERAAKSMSRTKKKQYQQLQIENASDVKNHFLYFFVNNDGLVKIGVSKHYLNRKKYLETKLNVELTIHSVYYGKHNDVLKAEYHLHNLLENGQIEYSSVDGRLEWFDYQFFLKNDCKIIDEIDKHNLEKI